MKWWKIGPLARLRAQLADICQFWPIFAQNCFGFSEHTFFPLSTSTWNAQGSIKDQWHFGQIGLFHGHFHTTRYRFASRVVLPHVFHCDPPFDPLLPAIWGLRDLLWPKTAVLASNGPRWGHFHNKIFGLPVWAQFHFLYTFEGRVDNKHKTTDLMLSLFFFPSYLQSFGDELNRSSKRPPQIYKLIKIESKYLDVSNCVFTSYNPTYKKSLSQMPFLAI